eukprot:1390329-Amorphochlora_amoeboformis.AAC.1
MRESVRDEIGKEQTEKRKRRKKTREKKEKIRDFKRKSDWVGSRMFASFGGILRYLFGALMN